MTETQGPQARSGATYNFRTAIVRDTPLRTAREHEVLVVVEHVLEAHPLAGLRPAFVGTTSSLKKEG
jgi:hypothetical protein